MKKILIIDDEDSIRTTVGIVLRTAGYLTLQAANGAEGLKLAREQLPDVTLCDVNMPDMDGRAVLGVFRSDPELARCAFVMMTGNQAHTPQRAGMNLGADDYLAKPFSAGDLVQCVETRLKRTEQQDRAEGRMLRELRSSIHGTMPHEFYTPLTGIIGLSDILKEDAARLTPDEIVGYARDIAKSGQRLHRTLRNYLRMLDLDQGDVPPVAPVPLGSAETKSVVEAAARTVVTKHHRGTDLALQLQPCTPRIDPDSLATFVEELMENACAFSPAGTQIGVELFPDQNMTALRVSDHGRGMTAEQIARVGAFTQFDRKRYEQQGLGLGLTLVSRQLERVGGTLSLESSPGAGVQALIHLP